MTNGLGLTEPEMLDKSHLYTFLSPRTRQDLTLPSQESFPELGVEGEGDLWQASNKTQN